ncbi:translation initiation factor IF-2 [Tropilaelaps mercedesae]|uniref:Translation initiation factor IF-2 n=1 Tax=Tropilaelaps mercedesae TaxID=418985 RepID=A0A1V9XWJ5_9ACAR|nr:translation initiation factor IF-2 [Tropilaelaps mercedesae]
MDAEEFTGEASVLQEFMVTDERSKKKVPVAGCSGTLVSMKHLKEEVNTIKKDTECGLMLEDSTIRLRPGDKIICTRRFKVPQKTTWTPPGF